MNVYSGNGKYDIQHQITWNATKTILHNQKKILDNDVMSDIDTQSCCLVLFFNDV